MALKFPTEGRNYIWDAAVHNGTRYGTWYVALFEGDYTPDDTDTAANFASRATEITAYTSGTRPELVESVPAAGGIDNSTAVTQVTLTTEKTVHGFAILSAPAKGATTGVLLCIQKLTAPRTYGAGDVVKIPVVLSLANVS